MKVLKSINRRLDGELVTGSSDQPCYYVFDLPDDARELKYRWWQLIEAIESLGTEQTCVKLCPSGVVWEQVEANGWEGVVMKRLSSFYLKSSRPDTTTPHWVKYRAEWL